jgi:hypothetical protein
MAIWLLWPISTVGQELKLSWSDRGPIDAPGELTSIDLKIDATLGIHEAAQISLPVPVNQVKNVNAGWDLDGDGAQEIAFPAVWVDGEGINRRNLFVYENTGDDSYEQVWTYQFPGVADQFTTVDYSDLDGDGAMELLAINSRVDGDANDGPELYVFENAGDNDYGTEPTATWDLGSAEREVVRVAKAADLDGDGTQEVALVTYQSTYHSMIIASVSDFDLPVWTIEYTNDVSPSTNDIAGIGIGDMDGNGTHEVCVSEQVSNSAIVVYSTGADTYDAATAAVAIPDKAVTVHGTEVVDLNGDGAAECLLATLQGAIYLIDGGTDASAIGVARDGHRFDGQFDGSIHSGQQRDLGVELPVLCGSRGRRHGSGELDRDADGGTRGFHRHRGRRHPDLRLGCGGRHGRRWVLRGGLLARFDARRC